MPLNRKSYAPSRTFDDNLQSLIALCRQEGWSVPTVDLGELEKEVALHQSQRVEFNLLEQKYLAMRESFALAKEQRWNAYAALLNGLRGALRRDKRQLAKLAGFKVTQQRSKKDKPESPKAEPESPPA